MSVIDRKMVCLHKVRRDSKDSHFDSKFTTLSKFTTRSIFGMAGSFGIDPHVKVVGCCLAPLSCR